MSSTDAGTIRQNAAVGLGHVPGWLLLGFGIYALLVFNGNLLLNDSDTYWQIAVGRSILDHGAFPHADIYSFTKAGEPWISTSWLAQILYAEVYDWGGWAGPVILAAASIAFTFAFFAFILGRRIPAMYAVLVSLAAFLLSTPHLLARPHVLAFPVMIAWVYGLLSASEQQKAPSFWLLPLLVLWANLHGGFVFGLVLVGPLAFDALWNAEKQQRKPLALRWIAFGIGALVACCATPYGWDSILAARKILDLGELLRLIYEWMPANFSQFGPLEASILLSIAAALYCGVRFTLPRIMLVLGLLHMALSHGRNIEIFALLTPLVVLAPLSSQFAFEPARFARMAFPAASGTILAAILAVSTWAFVANRQFVPPANQSPVAAVDALMEHNPKRVLNELAFAGYLISRGMPVFIDGRAELYGEQFEMAYYHALQLANVNLFLAMLKNYDIDAVLLEPETPAASMMDHIDGWKRIYADDNAVVAIRVAN